MPRRSDDHPPLRWFADRADGLLSASRLAKLTAHLGTGCTRCAARDASLLRTLAALKSGPLDPAPRALVRPAARLHAARRAAEAAGRVRDFVVRLLADTRAAPAFAMRAAPGDERRLLFAAGPWEVDLSIVTGASSSDVTGQVTSASGDGAAPEGGVVRALRGRRSVSAMLAPDGRFELHGLAPGEWTIRVRAGGVEFELPRLVIERAG